MSVPSVGSSPGVRLEIGRYAPDAMPETAPILDRLVQYALAGEDIAAG